MKLLAAITVIGCGSSHATSDATSGSDAAHDGAIDATTSTLSAGCGMAPPHTGSFMAKATDGNGTMRDYSVEVPSPYDPTKPLAITFAYHGAGGSSAASEGFGIQNGSGAAANSIFVFPQGIAFQTYGVGWDDSCGGYDMVLFDHMLADLSASYCIDTRQVFAAGFSWGCDQVTALTCCRGDKIRAISGASCTDEFGNPNDATTYANLACPHLGHTAIRFTHDASGGDSAYPAPEFTTTSTLYRTFNACPTHTGTLTPNQCFTYPGCADPFIECPYTGLGHSPPVNWGPDTWSFFAAQP